MSALPAFAPQSFAPRFLSSAQPSGQMSAQGKENGEQPNLFFQAIFESMMHGVLILNEKREVVQANRRALSLCQQLSASSHPPSDAPSGIPESVWNVCRALLSSRQALPQYQVIPEEEVELEDETHLKIYAQWLDVEEGYCCGAGSGQAGSYMLVTLEDRTEMLRNLARWDARRYGLTVREAEVWMLKCQNYSYDEIAAELYISRNTVKKHLKSISLKRGNDLD